MQSRRPVLVWTLIAIVALSLAACSRASADRLSAAFPDANAISGWKIGESLKTYTKDNLFDLVDGQADAFFAYGFQKAAVTRYTNTEDNRLNAEIWQLSTPADAFGLYASGLNGKPVAIGSEGTLSTGRRLAFWQDRYSIAITAYHTVSDDTLMAFGQAISKALPSGGERPALLKRLPANSMVAGSAQFFHEEISIQAEVWLGGANILGLSQKTNGVMARYTVNGQKGNLIVLQYPSAADAAKGAAALAQGKADEFVKADARDSLLGAVFGTITPTDADGLLKEALK